MLYVYLLCRIQCTYPPYFQKILKIKDHISLQNCLLAYDFINKKLHRSFNNTFLELKDIHSIEIRISNAGNLYTPYTNTTRYGLNSIYRKYIDAWNHFTKQLKNKNLSKLPRYKLKKLITEQIFLTYITYSMTPLPATVDEMISASREFVQHSMLAFREFVARHQLSQILFVLNFPTRQHAFLLRLTFPALFVSF